MKKILAILGAIGLTTTASTTVIACSDKSGKETVNLQEIDAQKPNTNSANDVFSIRNMAYEAMMLNPLLRPNNIKLMWVNSDKDAIAVVSDNAQNFTARNLAYNGFGNNLSVLDFIDNAINNNMGKGQALENLNFQTGKAPYDLFRSGIPNDSTVYQDGTVFNIQIMSSTEAMNQGIIMKNGLVSWNATTIKVQLVVAPLNKNNRR